MKSLGKRQEALPHPAELQVPGGCTGCPSHTGSCATPFLPNTRRVTTPVLCLRHGRAGDRLCQRLRQRDGPTAAPGVAWPCCPHLAAAPRRDGKDAAGSTWISSSKHIQKIWLFN